MRLLSAFAAVSAAQSALLCFAMAATAQTSAAPGPDVVPPDQIHPITSLPKPPGAAPVATAQPSSIVAGQPTPVAPPSSATIQDSRPTTAFPPATEAATPATTTPLHAAPPPQPTPVDVGPPPTHASILPAVPTGELHASAAGPQHMRPFAAIGIALTASVGGAGIDVAVPLAQHVNARAGASFFQYSGSYGVDGVTINGEVKFRDARFALDLYPFKGTQFRISPGVTLYNGNNLNASAFVPAGQTFTLNDTTYTSAANDPVNGSASMTFGYRTAPSATIGWGNLVPRKRAHHLSIPFEIGAQYIDNPKVSLLLSGTACSTETGVYGCAPLSTDPTAQENLREQEQKINNDLHAYARFYPILSIGVGWSFNLRRSPHAGQ